MLSKEACTEVHCSLAQLPTYTKPSQIPFIDGLYFFYEEGENSPHGPSGRIVRVGNHPRSDGGLARRLRQHYSGRKNGSAFRKLLGGALIRDNNPESPCLVPAPGRGHWERQNTRTCHRCEQIEEEVSTLLRSRFKFRCVEVQDRGERNRFEALLVATLAACPVCRPSRDWLGFQAYSNLVRRTGLWNSQFVDGPTLEQQDLNRFMELGTLSIARSRSFM